MPEEAGQGSDAAPPVVQSSAGGDGQGGQQQQQSEYSPLYSDFIQGVPEAQRPLIEPHVKNWDAKVTKKFQEYASQLQPYQELGDPEDLQLAVQLKQMLETDPRAVYNQLAEALADELQPGGQGQQRPVAPGGFPQQFGQQQFPQQQGQFQIDPQQWGQLNPQQQQYLAQQQQGLNQQYDQQQQQFQLPPEVQQQMTKQQKMLEQMAQVMVTQDQERKQQEEEAALDKLLNDTQAKYPDVKFMDNEEALDFVLLQLQRNKTPDDAIKALQAMQGGGGSQRQIPPSIGGGGAAVTAEQSPKNLSSKDRKAFIASVLSGTGQQRQ